MSGSSRFRIPAHVFGYSIACVPAIAYAFYYRRSHDSKEIALEETLRQNYSHNISNSEKQRQDMVQFMAALKNPGSDAAQKTQERLDEVLQGGKGEMKRHYRVDPRYYGTTEGLEEKARVEQALKKQEKNKNTKTKDGPTETKPNLESKAESKTKEGEPPIISAATGISSQTQSAITLVAVAAVATTAGFFLGGSRSSSR